ncbi:MAG TPA: hypothetical protein VFQ61_23585 [Polyangiaceae bacterium]|nr:hypothetical protein [Polyangiaceae bacterium]
MTPRSPKPPVRRVDEASASTDPTSLEPSVSAPPAATTQAPFEAVDVVEAEHIVARGTRRTAWFVRHNSGWLRAQQVEGAIVITLACGPGTVWLRRIELKLRRGTPLMCVVSQPRSQIEKSAKSPLAYLEKGHSLPKPLVQRLEYRVARGGHLERTPTDSKKRG